MATTITKETKNDLTVTSISKSSSTTWDEAIFTWDESPPSTWDSVRVPLTKETKNTLTITNESKN